MDDDAEKEASLTTVDAAIKADTYLSATLGALVMKSDLHPQWAYIDFPDYRTGTKLKQIRGAIQEFLKAGGEPAYSDTPQEKGYLRIFIEGRIFIHRDRATAVLKKIAQTRPETATDGAEEATLDEKMNEAQKRAIMWSGFLKANITDGRF